MLATSNAKPDGRTSLGITITKPIGEMHGGSVGSRAPGRSKLSDGVRAPSSRERATTKARRSGSTHHRKLLCLNSLRFMGPFRGLSMSDATCIAAISRHLPLDGYACQSGAYSRALAGRWTLPAHYQPIASASAVWLERFCGGNRSTWFRRLPITPPLTRTRLAGVPLSMLWNRDPIQPTSDPDMGSPIGIIQ